MVGNFPVTVKNELRTGTLEAIQPADKHDRVNAKTGWPCFRTL